MEPKRRLNYYSPPPPARDEPNLLRHATFLSLLSLVLTATGATLPRAGLPSEAILFGCLVVSLPLAATAVVPVGRRRLPAPPGAQRARGRAC